MIQLLSPHDHFVFVQLLDFGDNNCYYNCIALLPAIDDLEFMRKIVAIE